MKKAKNKIFNNLLTFDNKLFFKDSIKIEEFKKRKNGNLTNNYSYPESFPFSQKERGNNLKIEYCNILLQKLKKFPYKKEIYIDLSLENILKVKEKFCVLYIMIAHIFLKHLKIKHKVINIPNHTAIELNIGNKKYYFDNLMFSDIQEFEYGKKINSANLKGIYREIVFKNKKLENNNKLKNSSLENKNYKKIFGYSGNPEKILKSMILNDLGNNEKNIKKSYFFYKKALKLDKKSPIILANIGTYYLEIQEYKNSLNFYNKSLLQNPTNKAILSNKKLLFQEKIKNNSKNLQR